MQWDSLETWRAFIRRIHKVLEYRADGSVREIFYKGDVEE